MDRTRDDPSHVAVVDAWIARSVEHASSFEIVGLFDTALEAVWTQAVTVLGSATLAAIAERVLAAATGRHAFLSAINPRPGGDARWRQHLYERLAFVPRSELLEGLRFGLIELLTVIGRLTAELLSEELHAAVMTVTELRSEMKQPAGLHVLANAAGETQS